MKTVSLILILVGLLSGCARMRAQQEATALRRQRAAAIVVTGTEKLPGHDYRVLGMVRIDGDTIYANCGSSEALAGAAIDRYGSAVDAIVSYRSVPAQCSSAGGLRVCFTACEGTAVTFSD